jgi:DNA-binding transcriptional ArsR family regulator
MYQNPDKAAPAAFGRSAAIFAALGDATRLRIVTLLCAGGMLSISQLSAGMDITRQAVTKHLHVLSSAGLVRDHKIGRETRYELVPDEFAEAKKALEFIAGRWDEALQRLRLAVEEVEE